MHLARTKPPPFSKCTLIAAAKNRFSHNRTPLRLGAIEIARRATIHRLNVVLTKGSKHKTLGDWIGYSSQKQWGFLEKVRRADGVWN